MMLNETNYEHVILNKKSFEVEKSAITYLFAVPLRTNLTLEQTKTKPRVYLGVYSLSAF